MISVLVIVAIQDAAGWVVGFGVAVGFMLLSTIFFFLGSSLYVKVKANKSLVAGFAQVTVAAWKKKNLALPSMEYAAWYHHKGSKLVAPTEKLRYNRILSYMFYAYS
jgi:peptide/histidine transporter 3/4